MWIFAHCVYILASSSCLYKIYITNKVSTESRLLISAFYYIITWFKLLKNSWVVSGAKLRFARQVGVPVRVWCHVKTINWAQFGHFHLGWTHFCGQWFRHEWLCVVNLLCCTSCTLTTLHCSKVSFLQCCHMKIYNKMFTKMWGVYSLLWDMYIYIYIYIYIHRNKQK